MEKNQAEKNRKEKKSTGGMPKMESLSISDAVFPRRPAFGTKGRPVTLWANYMELLPAGDQILFRYSIDFGPDDKSGVKPVGKKCGRLIDILLEENFSAVRDKIASDFRSTFVSSVEIPLLDQKHTVKYRTEGEDEAGERAKTYPVIVKKTGTLAMSELMNYLTSSDAGALLLTKEELIQALNIVVGNYPKSSRHILSVGANKHYPHEGDLCEGFSLGCGLDALRGFFVSVRAATARILVNVQVKNTPCYQPTRLDYLMQEFCKDRSHGSAHLDRFLKRLRVQVIHIVRKNKSGKEVPRIKVISGLATSYDGQGQANPPRVPKYGATADNVKFFLSSESSAAPPAGGNKKGGKGKGPGGKPGDAAPPSGGKYISVSDFFKQSEYPEFR